MSALQKPSVGANPIIGKSAWTRRVDRTIKRVAEHESTVLITGPSGTGKELIAQAIHAQSPRANGPFIPVDCAIATGNLWASQLFGHVKGAFTGANYQSLGRFRAADGGTIFFDEIGELDQQLQAQLLRAIQERTVIPIGTHLGSPVNVRVIAATNRDLAERALTGSFRSDLYFRLKVISLETIPLRRRIEDVNVLARYFLAKFAVKSGAPAKRLSRRALEKLAKQLKAGIFGLPILTLHRSAVSRFELYRWERSIMTVPSARKTSAIRTLSFFRDVPDPAGPGPGFSRPSELVGTYTAGSI